MTVKTIELSNVDRNPFRDLDGHPLRPEQVEHLRASIHSTKFWGGLLVRPHPIVTGRYQLAFGHARYEAARLEGIDRADFIVSVLDDDAMLRAMADENITQFGRDEYATYREAVTAAVERIMGQVVADPSHAQNILRVPEDVAQPGKVLAEIVNSILAGEAPGEIAIARYFNGTFSLGAIRMALREYRDTGKLAAWHQKHNPSATKAADPPKLNAKALARFEETSHVQAFAETCEKLGVSVEAQPGLANSVLNVLKDTKPDPDAKTARSKRASKQFARTKQKRSERLTRDNIRAVATKIIAQSKPSKREQRELEMRAYAISIESALGEMKIGLQRAAQGAVDLERVAETIGGVHVDMTPTARMRLADCMAHYTRLEGCLKRAAGFGLNVQIGSLADVG